MKTKSYFNKTLKIIAFVTYRINISYYNTMLFLVNIQALYSFIEYKNCYMQQRYIILNNWLQIQNLLIPSQILNLEEFAVTRVHINQFNKISA